MKEIDTDGSGTIDIDEFKGIFSRLRGEGGEDTHTASREENRKVFRMFDPERTGRVTFENFRRKCLQIGENLTNDEMMRMINWADHDGDGALSESEFFNAVATPEQAPS